MKNFLVVLIVCTIGAFINVKVPDNWKYIFGFAVATILDVILKVIK